MGLALQVIVIVIAVTLVGKRSAGSNIAPSPSIFTATPPIEGLPVIPVNAIAPSPASLPNGSNISPSPLILQPPVDVSAPPPGFVQNGSNISPSPSTFTAIPVIPIDVNAPPPAILPNVSHIPPVLPPVSSAPGPETGHELVPPPTAITPSNQDPINNSPKSAPVPPVTIPAPSSSIIDSPPNQDPTNSSSPKPAPVLPVTIPAPSSSIIDSPPNQDPTNSSSPKHAPVLPVTVPTPSSSINISPPAPVAPVTVPTPSSSINITPPAPVAPVSVTIPPPSSSPQKPPSVDPVQPHLDPPSSPPNITPKNKAPPLQPHAPEPVISIVSSPPPKPSSKIDSVPVASPPNRKSRPISPVKSPSLQAPPIQKQNASGNPSNVAPLSSPESPPVVKPQAPASLPSSSNNHQIGKENITTPPPSSLQLPSPPPPIARAPVSPKSHASKQRGRAAPPSPSPTPKGDILPPPPGQTSLPLLSPRASPSLPSRSHSKQPLSPPIHALPPPPANEVVSVLSPILSPSGPSRSHAKQPLLPPIHALPPPPPNQDCSALTCAEPYTNTPPGSPCDCVYPMQVGLRLGVALYTFFPLVSELAEEISMGVFMRQSQVRIMGANAASQDPEKTIVLIDLVPLGEKFDNTTAFLTADRFWNKQVVVQSSLFGSYEVLYVRYPGLPPSPPSSVNVMDGEPYSGHGDNGRSVKPLGVDVSNVHHKKNMLSASVVAIIVLSASLVLILSIAVFWVVISKQRQSQQGSAPPPLATLPFLSKPSGNAGSILGSVPSSETLSIRSSMAPYTGSAKTFSSSDIEKATDSFNAAKVIGEGGFGRVYSGVLADGTEVAVKVLKRDDQQGGREFLAEVEMLSRLHHRNLVKLIGICTEDRARCLVYELIRNGSVESHLHGIDKEIAPLDWCSRLKIALGAARALAYLHEDSSPRVIHRDFKSSNILLEDDFTPKVSDFGLARTALEEENKHISTRVMGTFGYVAPEYAMTGHLLVKSDVYSYGVVLLELLTGKKPVDMSQPPGRENLVSWARPLLTNQEDLETIIDTSLGPDFPFDSIAKVSAIASMCVQPEVSHRPFMGEVVQALKLVCNECCDVARDLESRSFSIDPLDCGLDVESQFSRSGSDAYRFKKLEKDDSDSFRRHSSSGPLSIGRGDRAWHKLRGTVSEHGTKFRFWSGSH